MKKIEELKNYLLENLEELENCVRELNSWNSCLDYLDYQENGEYFFDTYFSKADEAVRAVCYGDYNYTDDYVIFNAYGNLESRDKYEFESILKDNIDEIIENLIEEYENLYLDEEIKEMIKNIRFDGV